MIHTEDLRKMKLIRESLSRHEGLTVRETKLDQYLFVDVDPMEHIPEYLRRGIKVELFKGPYTRFLKNAGRIGDLIHGAKPEAPEVGDSVRITIGRYEGFSGLVRSISGDKYEVEVQVWGNIMKTVCDSSELEKVEVTFE